MRIVKLTTFDGTEIALDADGVVSQEKFTQMKYGKEQKCLRLRTQYGAEYVIADTSGVVRLGHRGMI